MSGFDARVSVTGASIGLLDEHLEINIRVGIQLPFTTGPDQPPLVTDLGTLRFPFSKEQAIELFEKGLKAADELPDSKPTSSVATATSMSEVEAAARTLQEMNKAAKHE